MPRRPGPFRAFIRRRPDRGVVVLVIPTARIRRAVNKLLLALVVSAYIANFVLAEIAVRGGIGAISVFREFPVTSWGLYAELRPEEFTQSRVRLELNSPWDSADFDDYVRRYPTFLHGMFHARIHGMLDRGRDYPVRLLLRFLVGQYCAARPTATIGARPDTVRVRVIPLQVNRGRLLQSAEPEKVLDYPLDANGR